MTNETSILHRALAGLASVAITMSILTVYFATPQIQATAGMLA